MVAPPPSSLSSALTSPYRTYLYPESVPEFSPFTQRHCLTLPTHHDDPKPRHPDAIEPQEGRSRSLWQLPKSRIWLLRRASRRGQDPLGPGSGRDDSLTVDDEGREGRVDRHVDGGWGVAEIEGGGVGGQVEGGV